MKLLALFASVLAADIFLLVDTIQGESADQAHQNWIPVLSFQWGIEAPAEGKASFDTLKIKKIQDKSTNALLLGLARQQRFKKLTLSFRKSGASNDYFQIVGQDILVQSFSEAGSTQDDVQEQWQFVIPKISHSYAPTLDDGSLGPFSSFNWNEQTNASF
ncbi:hypothetical protein EDD86DRAFT_209389 [Gorgonomyces haynaldii]|nr:hypothetical protein EDD86DRAFT_209389 [Gorgonomyces haynaldii]